MRVSLRKQRCNGLPHKRQLTIRLDEDVLDWLKRQGRGYQTRINAILRAYYEAHKDNTSPGPDLSAQPPRVDGLETLIAILFQGRSDPEQSAIAFNRPSGLPTVTDGPAFAGDWGYCPQNWKCASDILSLFEFSARQ